MSRLGFFWEADRADETADEMARLCRLPGLEAEGLFTHFSDADGSEEYTMGQLTKFLDAKAALGPGGSPSKFAIVPPAPLCYTIPVPTWTWCVRGLPCTATTRRRS